jgi:hypothetical protein
MENENIENIEIKDGERTRENKNNLNVEKKRVNYIQNVRKVRKRMDNKLF